MESLEGPWRVLGGPMESLEGPWRVLGGPMESLEGPSLVEAVRTHTHAQSKGDVCAVAPPRLGLERSGGGARFLCPGPVLG